MSKKTFVMPNDLSELCRVCLQLPEESQYLDLTTIYDEEDNLSYGECFTICTQIDLSAGEGVPHHLCKSCGLELQMSYDFHKKIEESKRVIEQYQLQNEEQKANAIKILKSSGHSNKSTLEQLEEVQIICDKFEESYQEEELPVTPQEPEEDCEMKQDNDPGFISNIEIDDEVNDEMDIINKMCHDEVIKQQETPPYEENVSAKEINENINQDHLEMEDYQNLEALEEEETRRQLVTNINIQKKSLNEQQQIKVKDELKTLTESQAKYTTGPITSNADIVKIKTEIFDDHEDNNHETVIANKNIENIKIEKETISEYIVTSPNIIPASSSQLILDTQPPNVQLKTQNFFSCEFCGHKMPTRNALYKHRLRKHKDHKGFQQISSKSSKQFCYLCPKSFISNSLLKQHIDVEHFKKKFACEHCGHLLPTKNALCQHRLRKHRDIERTKTKSIQFKCPQCLDIFISAESLHLHSKIMHVKKPVIAEETTGFPCAECGHILPTRNALSQHRLRKHRMKKKRKNSKRQAS